jgi:hypothetical protein
MSQIVFVDWIAELRVDLKVVKDFIPNIVGDFVYLAELLYLFEFIPFQLEKN